MAATCRPSGSKTDKLLRGIKAISSSSHKRGRGKRMRNHSLVSLLICFIVASCQTAAQKRAEGITAHLANLGNVFKACQEPVINNTKYSRVIGNLYMDFTTSPSLDMLNNKDYPSNDDVAALYSIHEELQPCRNILIQGLGSIHPALVVFSAEHYARFDGNYLKLVNKEVTWGEANQWRLTHKQWMLAEMNKIENQIDTEIQNSHQFELQQRQAANAAWQQYSQQWLKQHSFVYGKRPPRTTTCQFVGHMLQCSEM